MTGVVLRLVLRGIRDLALHPWAQVLTLAAVTLVAFLGGLFLLFLHNLDQELLRVRGEVAFQVYWSRDADMQRVHAQWNDFEDLEFLQDLVTYEPAQALDALAVHLGDDVDLDWLKRENPLPATALLSFTPLVQDAEGWTKDMLIRLQGAPGVDTVHFNPLRTDLSENWRRFSRRVVWPLIGFLALVLALVVGNTIKLSQLSRSDEQDILHLVGARTWYIQLPLLAGGALQGLLGGALALAMLKGVQVAARDLLNFPPLFLELRFLPPEQVGVLLAVLVGVGLLSSWVAVKS